MSNAYQPPTIFVDDITIGDKLTLSDSGANTGQLVIFGGEVGSNDIEVYRLGSLALTINTDATTGSVFDLSDTNTLTTGALAKFYSNSTDTSARDLLSIHNDNTSATGALTLRVTQDAVATAAIINQNANGVALQLNSSGTGSQTLLFNTTTQTTGNILDIPNADSLTTGAAISVLSNSSSNAVRNLLTLTNTNIGASGTTLATFTQNASGTVVTIQQNSDGNALTINTSGTTLHGIHFNKTTQTTGNIINIPNADSLTTGGGISVLSNSSSNAVRSLLTLTNTNTGASGTTLATFTQNASGTAVTINQYSDANGLTINTSGTTLHGIHFGKSTQTTGNILNVPNADSLTTGAAISVLSNSSSNAVRNLLTLTNTNTGASGTTLATLTQNASGTVLALTQNSDGTALLINTSGTTANGLFFQASRQTVGNIINIPQANSLTTGTIGNFISNSNNTSVRNLIFVRNQNASAVSGTVLNLQQDAQGRNLFVSGGWAQFSAGVIQNRTATAGNYTVLRTDYIIGVTSGASTRTITLPDATLLAAGQTYIIKDEGGISLTSNIVIKPSGTQTIDGVGSIVEVVNFTSNSIYTDAANWFTF